MLNKSNQLKKDFNQQLCFHLARPSKTAQHGFAGCSVASAPAMALQQVEMQDTASCQIRGGRGCNTAYKHCQTSPISVTALTLVPTSASFHMIKNGCLAQKSTGSFCSCPVSQPCTMHTQTSDVPTLENPKQYPRNQSRDKRFCRPAVWAFNRKPVWFCSCAWRAPYYTKGIRLSWYSLW